MNITGGSVEAEHAKRDDVWVDRSTRERVLSFAPTGTLFAFTGSGANAQVQPYVAAYKAAGTGVGTVDVDFAKVWQYRRDFSAPCGVLA
jgi:hypothetical protein